MLDAHALGYRALHRTLLQPRVGIVLNMPRFAPADPSRALDRWAAAAQDWAFNGAALYPLSLLGVGKGEGGRDGGGSGAAPRYDAGDECRLTAGRDCIC